jgi:hypothetical protein
VPERSIEDGVGAGIDGDWVVGAHVHRVDAEPERVGVVDPVAGEQIVDDRHRVPAVVVSVTAGMVNDEEQAAAVLHELHDGGLLRGAEPYVGFGDHELVEVRQVQGGAAAIADGATRRERLQAVLAQGRSCPPAPTGLPCKRTSTT